MPWPSVRGAGVRLGPGTGKPAQRRTAERHSWQSEREIAERLIPMLAVSG